MAVGKSLKMLGGLGANVGVEGIANFGRGGELDVGRADLATVGRATLNVLGNREVHGFVRDGVLKGDELDVMGVRVRGFAAIARPG